MSALTDCPGGYFTNGMQTPPAPACPARPASRSTPAFPTASARSRAASSPAPCRPPPQIGLTAAADGLKADATALGYGVNSVTTVAGAADSVLAPYAYPGAVCVINNDGANALQVFGKGTDTIDGIATGTGNALTNATRGILYGVAGAGDGSDAGAWVSLKGAKIT
jgi:hypothetical protein